MTRIADDLDRFSKDAIATQHKNQVDGILTSFLVACQNGATFRIGRVQEMYNQIIPTLCKITLKQPNLYTQASSISKQLVSLEGIPEAWKQTQFWHVANFPTEQW